MSTEEFKESIKQWVMLDNEHKQYNDKVKQIRARISSFKNSLITVRAYYNNPELIEAKKKREERRG